jgi:8-oxo-dGTP diphosphatase
MTDEKKIYHLIESFAKKLPRFPDGRIDYTHSDTAPVITVFISFKGRILLLKRSDNVLTYKGKWNTVAGYLDEIISIKEKVYEELFEELGIKEMDIRSISIGGSYSFTDPSAKRSWIVHPVKVELAHDVQIRLDWEHTEYRWIDPDDINDFDTVPNAKMSLKRALEK